MLANYRPEDAILFDLQPETRIMRLRSQLDRENIDVHEVRVIATNRRDGPQNPNANSMLIVNITVEINYI